MKKSHILILLSLLISVATAQAQTVRGKVTDTKGEAIIGATLKWKDTNMGAVSDLDGNFNIEAHDVQDQLIVSYVGYKNDTITVDNPDKFVNIVMKEDAVQLSTVVITGRKAATVTSRLDAGQSQTLTGDELCKAACCNLSESFETNASVDVAYSDAATGAKTIRMLGLSGTYVQMLSENTPGVRGLAANYGMEYIPGSWMESIQVSKGTSSVINGYEATTGQINVEYIKPQKASPIAINGMLNHMLRAEINATGGWELTPVVSTAVLAHYKTEPMEHDGNGDGFLDLPKNQQINALNRWYFKTDRYTGQILFRGLYDERHGGQSSKAITNNRYGIDINTTRFEGFMKNGYVFDKEKGTSIGLILSASYHHHDSEYGKTTYDAKQTNVYFNGIFQTNFTDDHKLSAGLSINYDKYNETLYYDPKFSVYQRQIQDYDFNRSELTSGIFAEYAYNYTETLSLILGLRGDYSNRFGFFATPRFNIRYAPWEWLNIRASVGLGYRSPNIISDNGFMLPSSRNIYFYENYKEDPLKKFRQERAMNTGASLTFHIPIQAKELRITAEYYYTHFFESVVADLDSDPHEIRFYNLDGGRSYAGSFQVEAEMEILRGWTMTAAFRHTDVKQTIGGVLREKPLTNRFKGLITTSYQTPLKKWQFDFTAQFNGGGRMPDGFINEYQNNDQYHLSSDGTTLYYKWYPQLMAQVTRYFKNWSIYIGGENLTNFKQSNPIVNGENPYSSNFDGSMAWGPIHGTMAYIGFRWAIDKDYDKAKQRFANKKANK
ncbi:MAG: TonB-dependent receptor [Bacteroidales bacterium]|nr:TonB-dependent receptor [Bacteroidales bacterium]